MQHYHFLGIGLLGIILTAGCAGKSERVDLKFPIASGADAKVAAMSSATVAIQPFEDDRTEQSHLGTRFHLWGGESHFNLPSGTLGEATGFVQHTGSSTTPRQAGPHAHGAYFSPDSAWKDVCRPCLASCSKAFCS